MLASSGWQGLYLHKVKDPDVVRHNHVEALLVQQGPQDGCMVRFYWGDACQQLEVCFLRDLGDGAVEGRYAHILKQEGACSKRLLGALCCMRICYAVCVRW